MYGRQAFKVDGKFKFWGGLVLEVWGGGPGLYEQELKAVQERGIEVLFETRATSLLYDEEKVYGVKVKHKGKVREIHAKAVILASGGFEANRSEEHTSELQSLMRISYAVFCLKKKTQDETHETKANNVVDIIQER